MTWQNVYETSKRLAKSPKLLQQQVVEISEKNNIRPRFNPAKPYRNYRGHFSGKGQPKYGKRKHPRFAEQHEKL